MTTIYNTISAVGILGLMEKLAPLIGCQVHNSTCMKSIEFPRIFVSVHCMNRHIIVNPYVDGLNLESTIDMASFKKMIDFRYIQINIHRKIEDAAKDINKKILPKFSNAQDMFNKLKNNADTRRQKANDLVKKYTNQQEKMMATRIYNDLVKVMIVGTTESVVVKIDPEDPEIMQFTAGLISVDKMQKLKEILD